MVLAIQSSLVVCDRTVRGVLRYKIFEQNVST